MNSDNNGLPNTEMKSIFENPILQTSYNLFTKLRRIIIRKENLTKINYFDKWQKICSKNDINNNNIINEDNENDNDNNNIEENNNNLEENTTESIQNRNIIQNILMSNEELDQTSSSPNKSHNEAY